MKINDAILLMSFYVNANELNQLGKIEGAAMRLCDRDAAVEKNSHADDLIGN